MCARLPAPDSEFLLVKRYGDNDTAWFYATLVPGQAPEVVTGQGVDPLDPGFPWGFAVEPD